MSKMLHDLNQNSETLYKNEDSSTSFPHHKGGYHQGSQCTWHQGHGWISLHQGRAEKGLKPVPEEHSRPCWRTDQGKGKKKGKNNACCGCGGVGHLIKDCPNPVEDLNFQGGRRPSPPPPTFPLCIKKGSQYIYYSPQLKRRYCWTRERARTYIEPEAKVHINNVQVLSLIDTGSSISLIDVEFCKFLKLQVIFFHLEFSMHSGTEGKCLAIFSIPIQGWVKV